MRFQSKAGSSEKEPGLRVVTNGACRSSYLTRIPICSTWFKKQKPTLIPAVFSYIDFCLVLPVFFYKHHSCFKSLSQCCSESQRTPCLAASKVMFCFYSTSLKWTEQDIYCEYLVIFFSISLNQSVKEFTTICLCYINNNVCDYACAVACTYTRIYNIYV